MAWNRGVSFGILNHQGDWNWLVLSVLSLVIVAGLAVWLARVDRRLLALALGLVIGGALGNVVDRLRFGAIADFLDVHVGLWHWPAFNTRIRRLRWAPSSSCWNPCWRRGLRLRSRPMTQTNVEIPSVLRAVAAAGLLLLALPAARTPSARSATRRRRAFQVVARAPLSVPPDFTLRPPQPGATRPQEGTTRDQARATLLGERSGVSLSLVGRNSGDMALLTRAGASQAQPGIRELVDKESQSLAEAGNSFTDKLVFWRKPEAAGAGEQLDAAKEASACARTRPSAVRSPTARPRASSAAAGDLQRRLVRPEEEMDFTEDQLRCYPKCAVRMLWWFFVLGISVAVMVSVAVIPLMRVGGK